MAERILEIEVPKFLLGEIEESFEDRDPLTHAIVKDEVNRVIEALRLKGIIAEENDISVSLRGNPDLLPSSRERRVKVIEIFREDEDRRGAIDTSSETYLIEISPTTDN
ncbi:MAG: hypothetical protein ACOYT7_02645 [Patescibacteria group bacterium]